MKWTLLSLLVLAWSMAPQPAHADWVTFGAAAQCDTAQGLFSVVPVVKTSAEEDNVLAPKGFVEFDDRENQHFNCKLGKTAIRLIISVWEPSATGEGQGAGVVQIAAFSINGHSILKPGTSFLWQVRDERVLSKIVVKSVGSGYDAMYCYSSGFQWDEQPKIKDMTCQQSPL
jgi:hypothetical protein